MIRFNPYNAFCKRQKGGVYIPPEVVRLPDLSWPDKVLLSTLYSFFSSKYDPQKGIWPNYGAITERNGMSKSAISKHMKRLIEGGYVEVEEIGGDEHYWAVWHPEYGDLTDDLKAENEAVEFPNGNTPVSKRKLPSFQMETQCFQTETASFQMETPCNKDLKVPIESTNESNLSPEDIDSSEGNEKSREQLAGMSEVALLKMLMPLSGEAFCRKRCDSWKLAFRIADIKLVLINAILEKRDLDWVNDELESRRNARQQGVGKDGFSRSGGKRGGYGLSI